MNLRCAQCLSAAWNWARASCSAVQGAADGNKLRSFSARRACTNCGKGFADPDPQMFSYNSARGWCTDCFGTGLAIEDFDAEQTGEEGAWEEVAGEHVTCPACDGKRLNETALAVKFRDQSIAQLTALPVAQLQRVRAEAAAGRARDGHRPATC